MNPKYENKQVGNLQVLNHIKRGYYNCQCKCGNIFRVRMDNVISGQTRTCPRCASRKLDNNQAAKNNLYKSYRRRAGERKPVPFELTMDQFVSLIEQDCFYCGMKPAQSTHKWPGYFYNGVDRIDNDKGYTTQNSVTACKMCNLGKNSTRVDIWIEWIYRIYKIVSQPEFLRMINERMGPDNEIRQGFGRILAELSAIKTES